ncbi:hypothetical protein H4Q26_011359 [Puccinia striiformis f. sp. tritici PST-130]|nr:hypothetical protein H4Q26_011359 [Puccinia striiformis f. sp. tritici PST-130]
MSSMPRESQLNHPNPSKPLAAATNEMVKASIQSLREDYPVDVIFQPDIRQIRANFADQLSRATNRYDRQNTLLLEGVHQMSARSVAVKQQPAKSTTTGHCSRGASFTIMFKPPPLPLTPSSVA